MSPPSTRPPGDAMAKRERPTARCYLISESAEETPATERVHAPSRRARVVGGARQRIVMGAIVLAAAFGALGLRLVFVAAGPAPLRATVEAGALSTAERSEIVDRNGELLALNLPLRALEIAGAEVWDPVETAREIAGIFPQVNAAELEAKLAAKKYVEIYNRVTPAEEQAVFALGLPGVRFSPRVVRYYPQGAAGAHVIGHLEPGRGGVMGLERVLDARESDLRQGPLAASIDIRVQQVFEEELDRALKTFHAKAAFGGIMDVETGELIALASLPDFDPNAPGEAPADYRRNRAIYDRYEMGSAFKLFAAAAALETGVATERSTYDARGVFKVADKTIRDFHGENRVLTLGEAVQYSSNIAAARIAGDLGPARLKDALGSLGLLEPLAIEFYEKRAPELPAKWGPVENATISYGHGISVTPLHLLAATAAVVNGGVYHNPTFLARREPDTGVRVFSSQTSATMRRIMRNVVTSGTASLAEAPGYSPIGKTATAEKPSAGGYNRNARLSSFVGAFPADRPRYAVLVTLDEPQPVKGTWGYATAGWNAAPTFSAIVMRAAPLLGVMPDHAQAGIVALAEPKSGRGQE